MSEMIQKNETDLDNMENFETGKDSFAFLITLVNFLA